jgi:hypothetical protein
MTCRRVIAVAAAYVLALQAWVSAFVPLPPASLASAALCLSGQADSGSAPPASHEPCPACLSGACHAASGANLAVSAVSAPQRIAVAALVPAREVSSPSTPRTRQHARAPPA